MRCADFPQDRITRNRTVGHEIAVRVNPEYYKAGKLSCRDRQPGQACRTSIGDDHRKIASLDARGDRETNSVKRFVRLGEADTPVVSFRGGWPMTRVLLP